MAHSRLLLHRPRADFQEQRDGSSRLPTLQAVQKSLEECFRSNRARDRSPKRRAADAQLLGHFSEHVVADLSTAGSMRDVRYRDDLPVVPAGEVGMVSRWIRNEAMLARQRSSHFAGGERHLSTREEAFEGAQLLEQSWMELGPVASKERQTPVERLVEVGDRFLRGRSYAVHCAEVVFSDELPGGVVDDGDR